MKAGAIADPASTRNIHLWTSGGEGKAGLVRRPYVAKAGPHGLRFHPAAVARAPSPTRRRLRHRSEAANVEDILA
jgi:hypothetical protein